MKKDANEYAREQAAKLKPIRIPVELHTEFKAMCASEGRTMGWVMTKIVTQYIKDNK